RDGATFGGSPAPSDPARADGGGREARSRAGTIPNQTRGAATSGRAAASTRRDQARPAKNPLRQPRTGDGEFVGPSEQVVTVRTARTVLILAAAGPLVVASTTGAFAQDISINFGQGSGITERVIQLVALLTVLSLAPS